MKATKLKTNKDYRGAFRVPEKAVFKAKRGLNEEVIRDISAHKNEPAWMLDFRLKAFEIFKKKKMPTWGADLSTIKFDEMFYYLKPSKGSERSWDDVPDAIKKTFDRLGIPEAEKKHLAGVGAQYESEVVYHSLEKHLCAKGVIFCDTDAALRDHPELFRR
jgi:Fe-S cluster assembly protein SufB